LRLQLSSGGTSKSPRYWISAKPLEADGQLRLPFAAGESGPAQYRARGRSDILPGGREDRGPTKTGRRPCPESCGGPAHRHDDGDCPPDQPDRKQANQRESALCPSLGGEARPPRFPI